MARHKLGHYRSLAVTGRYSFPSGRIKIPILKSALRDTIGQHPNLCLGITFQSKSHDSQFTLLEQIAWHDVVEFHDIGTKAGNEYDVDEELERVLEAQHERLWDSQHKKPLWRLVVIPRNSFHEKGVEGGPQALDIIFLAHHAIADGRSGAAFHKTLLKAFQHHSSLPRIDGIVPSNWPYQVPTTIVRPLPMEVTWSKQLSSTQPLPSGSGLVAAANDPLDPWTGPLPVDSNYKSRVLLLTIPEAAVAKLKTKSRALNLSITALLHELIIKYLSTAMPTAKSFRAVTPYCVRRFTGLPMSAIANHAAYTRTWWDSEKISSLRESLNSPRGGAAMDAIMTQLGQIFQADMRKELADVEKQGPKILHSMAAVRDFDEYCAASMQKKRNNTYELSNIGVVSGCMTKKLDTRPHIEGDEEKDLGISVPGPCLEKLVFTQCGVVVGAPFTVNVVTLEGGPMVLSLTWQDGVVEDSLLIGLKSFLRKEIVELEVGSPTHSARFGLTIKNYRGWTQWLVQKVQSLLTSTYATFKRASKTIRYVS